MNILSIISPLITIALLGFICTKSRWLTKEQINALSKFTFSLSIPAFLFYQMVKAEFSTQINPQLFAAFYIPVLTCYLITYLLNFFFYKEKHVNSSQNDRNKNSAGSAVFALGSSYSNNVIVGLPVLLSALGEKSLGIIFLIVTFHSAMLFTLTGIIAANAKNKQNSTQFNYLNFIKQTINNPLIISILLGLFVNIIGITLPDFINNSLDLISKPAIPLALFILGASLTFYKVRQELTFISIACVSKLVLLPTLVLFASQEIFKLDPFIVTVLVILSACPTGVNAYLIAVNHQHHQQTVAGTIVMSTLISSVTIPLWLLYIL